jgi:hypothetical protein
MNSTIFKNINLFLVSAHVKRKEKKRKWNSNGKIMINVLFSNYRNLQIIRILSNIKHK